jgi:hypothetical protein
MSVYTSYDCVVDCQANKPEGWHYLAQRMAPVLRYMAKHYGGDDSTVDRLLAGEGRLEGYQPAPERAILLRLRDRLVALCGWQGGTAGGLDLPAMDAALQPLTVIERQLIWYETMRYRTQDAALFLHVSEQTAAKAQARAHELLRAALDDWQATILSDNGGALIAAARATAPAEPVSTKTYLDLIDGRLTWRDRSEVDFKLAASWYEVDHLCRVREVDEAVRQSQQLTDEETYEYLSRLGLPARKPKKSWLGRLVGAD